MSWMVPKLNRRVKIERAENSPVGSGSFERIYTTLMRLWASVKVDRKNMFIQAIRGVNVADEGNTHIIVVRRAALSSLGKSFTIAFQKSFDSVSDINSIKSNYFIFLEETSEDRGRRMQVNGIQHDEVNKEYVRILTSEIEERGSGE